jgi:hypothetical protein
MVVKGFIYFIILSDNLKMSFIRLKVLLPEISIARWGGAEQNRPIFPFKPKNIQERSVLHPVIFRERKKEKMEYCKKKSNWMSSAYVDE